MTRDDPFPQAKTATYANVSVNDQSQIDYAVSSCSVVIVDFLYWILVLTF